MNNEPVVSVLVTVYNSAQYLRACLESILASTMRDFEVVIVDDLSSDGSVEIAEEFASRHACVRFIRNETNLGDYPNRMKAASLARGRYLKYVDSDDLIYPHTLAVMSEALNANADANLALSHPLPEADQPYPWKLSSHDAWSKEFIGTGCMGSGPTGAIIRCSAFVESGGFRNWGVLSDTDLWYRLSARAPIMLLPPGLVWWRRHSDQEFTKNRAELVYLERGFELVMATLASPESPLSKAETRQAIGRARQHHARRLLSLGLKRRMPLEAIRLIRRSGLSTAEMVRGLAAYR
jgi:glycosyltransferase involved in cell wall biosynthesis